MRTIVLVLAFATIASGSARGHLAATSRGSAPAAAQSPASSGAPPPASARAQSASSDETLPAPPPNFKYEPGGRRDPFVSLVNRGTDSASNQASRSRPEGAAGVMVDEVVVRGVVQSRAGWIAMVGSPNGRTYSVRPGDRLMDGSVHSITAQAVVLMQEVNDPLSLQKQREVRKYLRGEVK